MAIPPFRVKALYDYSSKEEDDLKFPNGQVILVTDEEDADWYYGEYEDSAGDKLEGLFPKNFVKIFEPDMPPRPTRSGRSKKDNDTPALVSEEARVPAAEEPRAVPAPAPFPSAIMPEQTFEEPEPPVSQAAKIETYSIPAQKPAPLAAPKPAPAPVAEKPTSGSFRDRINAFNKSTAPPPAPNKPSGLGASGGSGFVKKAFVAPPPSKNAYIAPPREPPPQKVYRREEDPEILAQASNDVENEVQVPQPQVAAPAEVEEDQPKPTSLKDRIALLQKQQMEQAARHAEASQKKEKPKRPPKKQVEPQEPAADADDDVEAERLERTNSTETTGKRSVEASRDAFSSGARHAKPSKSQEATPVASPTAVASRGFMSDPNDADQSGMGDTEDGEDLSTGRDDSDDNPRRKTSIPLQIPSQAPLREADVGDEEDNADDDVAEEEEDEDVDPEVKRRMEIRERMAKMSGGMGMAGMFGPPGGMAPRAPVKRGTASSERNISGNSVSAQADDGSNSRAPPVPIMPMPSLQKVRSPEQHGAQPEVTKEEADEPKSVIQGREPEDMPDIEDIKEEPIPTPRRSVERPSPPPVPQDRPVPAPPGKSRGAPPPLPSERPVPPPPSEASLVSRPPPSQPMSPSEGSESDDEMSLHKRNSLRLHPGTDSSRPISREDLPPVHSAGSPPTLPSRHVVPQSGPSDYTGRSPPTQSVEMSPILPKPPADPSKRSSRVPPIPGSNPAMSSAPQNRAPPPPPPTNAPPMRAATGDSRIPSLVPRTQAPEESDEEVTEYEGDYDTDMASGATHKDALKSHARVSSLDDDSMTEEASLHHSGLPSLGPTPPAIPRAVPPPPPSQPSRHNRQSSDMPRGAPPPPPPPKEQTYEDENDYYDAYKPPTSGQRGVDSRYEMEGPTTPRFEEPEAIFQASPPQRAVPAFSGQSTSQYPSSPNMAAPGRSGPRQSTEIQRTSTSIRRSTDASRPSGEQGFIAGDADLGHNSQWWARPDNPPPIFQNRRDLIFEIEETSTTRRGGKQAVTKMVYILFMDYSQTVITAQFEAKDPVNAILEQRHEPPPQSLRQDQLENAHMRLGSRIAEAANAKKETTVGDGSPHALVLDLLSALPEALLPVGVRAYGANVYANLANASVRQLDEIRPGDIVTFRNAKFQGHRGPMHSKYSVEVGKPDHVGVVIDWDGTKKKVRAWEQGRESKKVKPESFKFGDLRSGEVKVWRVMARNWVGWN
ncbi:hypothetical protein HO133_010126 [Letharia lupina]|uniref:SH3 domain-containing protein n=1 Tax=Letharia lupina TaxID=560253 RepID=A0A8H6FDX9_9LECA|nr:uncharacterized protein HO133_010126 [Letharia lupina]KAF6224932.1 hypothetical protein HO133_010126 [Letharia lupina]